MNEPTYALLQTYADHTNKQLENLQKEGKVLPKRPYEMPDGRRLYAVATNEHMYARFQDVNTGYTVEIDIRVKGPQQSARVTITRQNEDFKITLRPSSNVLLEDAHAGCMLAYFLDIEVTERGVVGITGGKPNDWYALVFGSEEELSILE